MVNGHQQWRMLALVGMAELLAMTPWFSATAVAADIVREFRLDTGQAAWITMGVQGGFVAGTLVSALLNLSDLVSARWVFAGGCLAAAAANAMTTAVSSPAEAVAWRFATGASLALVYPPGIKLIAGWFRHNRGMAIGALVGCLTLGKALPYLLLAWSHGAWRTSVLLASAMSLAAAVIVATGVRDGPHVAATASFEPSAALRVFTRRATRLGVLGYLGHMWELYAMWAWFGVFVTAALARQGHPAADHLGALTAFVAIGSGAVGCVGAGALADRFGRARVAAWALMVSATCCALTVPVFRAPFPVMLLLAAVWGISVVADSAQFSVIVSETSPPEHVGTALTVQTCLGFLLTMLSIRLVSAAAASLGWQWAFLAVLPGPVLGVLAMLALMRPKN